MKLRLGALALGVILALSSASSGKESRPVTSSDSAAAFPRDQLSGSATALVADTERIIVAFELDEWFDDEQEYAAVVPVLLESVCRVANPARTEALRWLARQQGTSPERLFDLAGGEMTSEVKDALTLRRQYVALSRALAVAGDRCPFWVQTEDDFRGRQTIRSQFVVHFEGGGVAQLRLANRKANVGGGGNGRLLLGYAFGEHWSLMAGPEVGGGALLLRSNGGQFTIAYFPAIPVVLRYRDVQWLYNLELAPVAAFDSNDTHLSFGGRIGGLVGISVLRAQGFLPWAGLAIDVEHYFEGAGRPAFQLIRGGLRIGFRWAP